jgi:two-component system, chemotaxis family, chemotaxis protein CheY
MNEQDSRSIRKAYQEGLVILVVEDYMVFSKEVRHSLPQHQVLFAPTLEDAYRQYEATLPNITFLDLDLPDGNGMAFLEQICAKDPTAYIVILSGSKLKEDIVIAGQRGAKGYVIKPFTHAQIKQHINKYMEIREENMKASLENTQKRRFFSDTSK